MSRVAFVTGASGFVGSHLVRQLHEQDWTVHALARPTASLQASADLPLQRHEGDITDRESVLRAMPEGSDAVFHVAASTNFWSKKNAEQRHINVDGTRIMLEAAVSRGARRFIHTSSFVTWGFQNGELRESDARTDATDWINYVRTKYEAEQLVLAAVQENGLDAVVLNPAHIMGPGDRQNWSRMIGMVNQGTLPGVPGGAGNFADVREVARAHIRAVDQGRTGEKYILGGNYHSFAEVMTVAAQRLGKKAPALQLPRFVMMAWAQALGLGARFSGKEPEATPEAAAMVSYRIRCHSDKAHDELDYASRDISTIIGDTIDWMKQEGLL